jgi:CMP-N-acetylneuraminic acid synthetase|tara:strand:+ start:603 stop:1286 length:684 start_codon:yes stop_codon:yes gene_type:complete
MKSINDVCFIIQTRLDSKRIPKKSIRPFGNTTLFNIAIEKILKSNLIPNKNVYISVYEKELLDIANEYDVNIYKRSYKSANEHGSFSSKLIYEWYDKLPYKYCILLNICNPFLTVKTIDNFVKHYINTESEGLFTVIEKKQYYWDINGKSLTDWKGKMIMNTNLIKPIYEAAHCLYASRMDIIGDDYWMDTNSPPTPELFVVKESESFDIDYLWQFEVGQKLYENEL